MSKTIEERYQKKTQLEHILLRPDTYIGSIEKNTQTLWVFDESISKMVQKSITYVPGLFKIFDEILVNAADVKGRESQIKDVVFKMTSIKVNINSSTGEISVWNDGDGIPVEIHKEHNLYVAHLIFGHLLTSDNYDDSEDRITGGRNGFGAKLANIFSKKFTVSCGDSKRKKEFKMTWFDNMTRHSEPVVSKFSGKDYVSVTFLPDYEKFGMEGMDEGTELVLKKRVYDIAGTCNVKVYLNNNPIPVKNFASYVSLYLGTDEDVVRIADNSERWNIVVTNSDGSQFQQVSFVNSICTNKGGTHVNYVIEPMIQAIAKKINSKNKSGMQIKVGHVKSHIWVFINCLITNPSFDSQTKETLTTKPQKFGSKYTPSDKCISSILKSRIMDSVLAWTKAKEQVELNRKLKVSNMRQSGKIFGVPKLEDASKAGTRYGYECTLILTEGDSAKTSCLAGLSVVGRDRYGVFPLKGKLLNVREASFKQLSQNLEIQNILKIVGLDVSNKALDNPKNLRYGSLMIMTDQDYDGSHIKGLLINLIHQFWPGLLKYPGFLREFVTPIIKATKGNVQRCFYTIDDYNRWIATQDVKGWKIKYYKGLGTSTDVEFKEYFKNIQEHLINFKWRGMVVGYIDEECDNKIDMAFNKKRVDDRKRWLQNHVALQEEGIASLGVDHTCKELSYQDFVDKELVLFSIYDTERSIPSIMDGLKPGQRKVLFGCFKRNLKAECKVAQLTGYIAEHTAYHHGETSLQQTIINMAQTFVGSNNINLLEPCGQFGSRKEGGKDASAARYIFTKLAELTRLIFPPIDDAVLEYQSEEGQSIEPIYFVPIIPMVLVNGCEGIGTGFSSTVPNFSPFDIIDNIKRYINEEELVPMTPWYRGFRGTITPNERSGFDVQGKYDVVNIDTVDSRNGPTHVDVVRITELPIKKWTQDYKEFLEAAIAQQDSPIVGYEDNSSHELIDFQVFVKSETRDLEKLLKLRSSISLTNLTLFDTNRKLMKYPNEIAILKDYAKERLKTYEKRKEYLLVKYAADLKILNNQVRFIRMVISEELVIFKKKKTELYVELERLQFDKINIDDNSTEYDYLLGMKLWALTQERIDKLLEAQKQAEDQLEKLKSLTIKQMWLQDLDALVEGLNTFYKDVFEHQASERGGKSKKARQSSITAVFKKVSIDKRAKDIAKTVNKKGKDSTRRESIKSSGSAKSPGRKESIMSIESRKSPVAKKKLKTVGSVESLLSIDVDDASVISVDDSVSSPGDTASAKKRRVILD